MTEFQTRQLREIRADKARREAVLIAAGAVAEIGVRYYPQIGRSNVSVIDTMAQWGVSRSFDGITHVEAVAQFARATFGAGGRLKAIERTVDSDGSFCVSYHVFK